MAEAESQEVRFSSFEDFVRWESERVEEQEREHLDRMDARIASRRDTR